MKGCIRMNGVFSKRFVKWLLVLLVLFSLLPAFSMAANDFYFKEADIVVSTEKDWICLTKDTQTVDLEGTPFNYVGMDALIQQQITQMNNPQHENLKVMFLYMDNTMKMVEVQLAVEQTDDSIAVWDISLYPEMENQTDARFSDAYTSKSNDKFLAVSQKDQDGDFLVYVTMNNGRSIVFSFRGYDLRV